MRNYVVILLFLVFFVFVGMALSGEFTPEPKFQKGDFVCLGKKEVFILRVLPFIGGNQYDIYDNGLRSVIDEDLLRDCDD